MAFIIFLHKEAEEPPIFKSCSNGMKYVKGQSYVQKYPFFFRFIRMQVWSLSFRELFRRELCRWLFRCLKKGKRHVSTQHGKRPFQKAKKVRIALYVQSSKVSTEKSSLSLLYNDLRQGTLTIHFQDMAENDFPLHKKQVWRTPPFLMPQKCNLGGCFVFKATKVT